MWDFVDPAEVAQHTHSRLMCDAVLLDYCYIHLFERIALRVAPAETRLTVDRRFEIMESNTKTIAKRGRVAVINAPTFWFYRQAPI